jgi:hypothetical protein
MSVSQFVSSRTRDSTTLTMRVRGTRTCAVLSLSRRVTDECVRLCALERQRNDIGTYSAYVSKSTVMLNGVPSSSIRAYLLPTDVLDVSVRLAIPANTNLRERSLTMRSSCRTYQYQRQIARNTDMFANLYIAN